MAFLTSLRGWSKLSRFSTPAFNSVAHYCDYFRRDNRQVTIPPYEDKLGEPVHIKRARLLYQSRKRGMLENGLLLSNFAGVYLAEMTEPLLSQYDRLINQPSNDWEIYYWATGVQDTPPEFDNEIMASLKQYVLNENRENRTCQPNL